MHSADAMFFNNFLFVVGWIGECRTQDRLYQKSQITTQSYVWLAAKKYRIGGIDYVYAIHSWKELEGGNGGKQHRQLQKISKVEDLIREGWGDNCLEESSVNERP